MPSTDTQQTELHELTDVQRQRLVKVDPREQAAYNTFFRMGPENPDKKIQLGNDFLQKYPKSVFVEAVESGLTSAYYAKEDWGNFYATADKALALKPDDVDILTTVGWVIPHVYNSSDPDASQKLDKAESYEKHAIQIITAMPKPASLTDAQFAAATAEKVSQAHSALGLVYFRRSDYQNSAQELQQAMQGSASPDPTDLFVLGMDLQNSNRFADAASAYGRCAQISGGLQERCKQSADAMRKQAPQSR
ncbi:MAG TPA: hypothetical protein VJO53_12790 [Candidatus Acidoferrales bacterium]|nr:hypothetical protein [Candidatus Acidoferrales bacterium]